MTCCSPRGGGDSPESAPTRGPAPADLGGGDHRVPQATVPAGTFAMGDAHGDGYRADGELPVHPVTLRAFTIDVTTVTVADFARFAEATGYETDAERHGVSAVFHRTAADPDAGTPVPGTPWWLTVPGAYWRAPGGPGSAAADDHPVVHVSHHDALAYCAWAGRALPTEAEWEYAARGGLAGARYPWGDDHPVPGQVTVFDGDFPWSPTGEVGTVAAKSLAPNGFGLYQTVGNVWEWCADRFSARYYRASPTHDPTGPERGSARVLRGGSHLCHDSYCYRYRVAARSHNTPDSTASNIGFRTVAPRS
ncbi:formylglycine-generating enzyme family protein [Nocardia thailandica]|uniref:formylglycine-generating enzyme family protein n=1 Tax=Nocardia thailandica TaxID=257275 RepID=UPI0002FF4E22|nr:formylglycine-generating enzyme family protein [Nocardia thailandica]